MSTELKVNLDENVTRELIMEERLDWGSVKSGSGAGEVGRGQELRTF